MSWNHRDKFQADEPLDEAKPGGKAPKAPRAHRGTKTFTCPGCGTHTYGDMAYCTQCGYKLSRKCPHCGAQWRYEYSNAFCAGCGARLQASKETVGAESRPKKAAISTQVGDES